MALPIITSNLKIDPPSPRPTLQAKLQTRGARDSVSEDSRQTLRLSFFKYIVSGGGGRGQMLSQREPKAGVTV